LIADAEICDLHNRVLSGFEQLSRQISRGEAGLQTVTATYATPPSASSIIGRRLPSWPTKTTGLAGPAIALYRAVCPCVTRPELRFRHAEHNGPGCVRVRGAQLIRLGEDRELRARFDDDLGWRLVEHSAMFQTLEQARAAIGAYIDRYHHRPHSRLAYRTPSEVAQTWKDHDDQLTPAA
jgi:hypothetical protein